MKSLTKVSTLLGACLMLASCAERITLNHRHYYQPETQVWDWQYDANDIPVSATVSVSCTNDDEKCDEPVLTLDATIKSETIREANCCESGLVRYTATANYEGTAYSQSKDIAFDKTAHDFSEWYMDATSHGKKCVYCGLLEEEPENHIYSESGEEYYTCSACEYVDENRKEEYETSLAIIDIQNRIASLLQEDIAAYKEGEIRDIEALYAELKDSAKEQITEYADFLAYKESYNETYETIMGDNLSSYGYNLASKASETEIRSKKNQSSDYGYGYELEVITPSKDNALRVALATPSYQEDDEYEGVFYTRNIPESAKITFSKADNMATLLDSTENTDLGNGWVERKLSKASMVKLISASYNQIYLQFGENDATALSIGEYFVSCLYAHKPPKATSGVHYLSKESTETTSGNKEYWVYDGKEKIHLADPDPTIEWREEESPVLSSSHKAYLAPKGTVEFSSTSEENWTIHPADPDNLAYVRFGSRGDGSAGGEYAYFRNYQWTDWPESKVGLSAVYDLPTNDDMRFVNSFSMAYYMYQPVSPVQVSVFVIDQNGEATLALEKTYSTASNLLATETVSFEGTNVKQLKIVTKAFTPGASGNSVICLKDLSASYAEPSSSVGTHYAAKDATVSTSGNKECWVLNGSSETLLENPRPGAEWEEGDPLDIANENNVAFLAKLGTQEVQTSSSANWTTDHGATDPIRAEYGKDYAGKTGCLSLRNYQYFDWKETQLGLTSTYTNPNPMVGVNTISFSYHCIHEGNNAAKADLNIALYVIDMQGNETLYKNFVIGKDVTGWKDFKCAADITNFHQLKIVTTSEFISGMNEGTGINTILYVSNLALGYEATEYGTINFSSTDPSIWTSTSGQPQDLFLVGTTANLADARGGAKGDYLCFRSYQWTDWPTSAYSTITATSVVASPKIVNFLTYDFCLDAGAFEGESITIACSIMDTEGNQITVDTFVIHKGEATGVDIHHSKTFDQEINVQKLVISVFSFKEGLASDGLDNAVFLKNISCQYEN